MSAVSLIHHYCTHLKLVMIPRKSPKNTQAKPDLQGAATKVRNGFVGADESLCGLTDTASSAIGLPIVPVRVKAKGQRDSVVTYAFLDSGSNSTFCSEELLEQLGVEGRNTNLSLTTMTSENSPVETHIVSLEVYDLDEDEFVDLPSVYSTSKLPVTSRDIPEQGDVDKWPHLSDLCVTRVNAEVGLLIGNDCAEALEPREVRQSKDKGPYAVKTIFGWTINGPLGRKQDDARRTANII